MRREEIDSFSAAVIPRARLRSLGFHDLDHVERSLESITRLLHRIGPEKGFLTLLLESAAVSADPDLSLTQFEGLLDRHPDPFGFCHQLLEGGRMSSLTYLLGAAPALAGWIARNPDLISKLIPSPSRDLLPPNRFDGVRSEILGESDPREARIMQEIRIRVDWGPEKMP